MVMVGMSGQRTRQGSQISYQMVNSPPEAAVGDSQKFSWSSDVYQLTAGPWSKSRCESEMCSRPLGPVSKQNSKMGLRTGPKQQGGSTQTWAHDLGLMAARKLCLQGRG